MRRAKTLRPDRALFSRVFPSFPGERITIRGTGSRYRSLIKRAGKPAGNFGTSPYKSRLPLGRRVITRLLRSEMRHVFVLVFGSNAIQIFRFCFIGVWLFLLKFCEKTWRFWVYFTNEVWNINLLYWALTWMETRAHIKKARFTVIFTCW